MSGTVLAVVYVVVLLTAVWASRALVGAPTKRTRRRSVVWVALVVVAVPSLLQLTVAPGLLGALERDRGTILTGQLWRLLTSLVVQDGGVAGTVFNLVFLVVVGLAATRVWRAWSWCVIALASGIGGELWGLLVQPVGAGNSVVNFGLAGSLAVTALLRGKKRPRVLGVVTLLGGLVLLVTGDVHGGALAVGAVLGLLLRRRGLVLAHLERLELPTF